jgi:hypothetical protein
LKEAAVDFLRLASSGNMREAYKKYVTEDFMHHNPYYKENPRRVSQTKEDLQLMSR